MRKQLYLLWTLHISIISFSQSVTSYLNKARNDMARGEYYGAAHNYLEALKIDSLNPKANLEFGLLNTEYINSPGNAGTYLLRAEKQSTKDTLSELILGLAQYYQSTGQYEKAIAYYKRMYGRVEKGSEKNKLDNMLSLSIASCQYALSPPPQAVFKRKKVVNVGKGVNTIYPEHSPVALKNGTVLLFTSRRKDNVGNKIDDTDGNYFEDMFIARKEGKEYGNAHRFTEADAEVKGLKNTKGHDAVVIVGQSGNRFFTCHENMLYESTWQTDHWTEPVLMNSLINPKGAYQRHITLSADGKTIYFASERPEGFGGLDIYKSELTPKGDWGAPVNLGATVNTKEDDDSPFLNQAGNMLYFSSKGLPGYGGYDLFRCNLNGKEWGSVENLGSLFNSSDNDTHLSFNADESEGFFSSGRTGGFGDMDIYQVRYELPFESFTVDPLARLNFKLPDTVFVDEPVTLGAFSNKLPPSAFKEYYWQVNDSVLASKGEIASYIFTKAGEAHVRIEGVTTNEDVTGYEKKVVVINRPVITVASHTTTANTNTVSPVTTGGAALENVYFEFNGHILNAEARAALLRNLKILAANPGMTIAISAYCDSRGPVQYNEALSKRRARSVEWYLVKHGLSKNRIKTISWFGEKDPLNKCADDTPCSAGEYKINRRVEIRSVK